MRKLKKILLVQPMHEKLKKTERTSFNFPWGLATLSRYYQLGGYEVEILDGQALQLPKEELLTTLNEYEFDVLGLSAFSTQYPAVKLIGDYIKENRDVPIIVGGPLATYQSDMVLKTTEIDVCVIGEGEISGVEVLNNIDELEKVKGIAFKQNGEIVFTGPQEQFADIDELPLPDFSLFDMETYVKQDNAYSRSQNIGQRAMMFITSRGCPYNCYFCSKSSGQFRTMSPKKIYKMLSIFKKEFHIEEIIFGDELFLSSKSRFREMEPLLKSLSVPWGGQARVNLMDEEFLDMIKGSGCIGIGYGIESGSPKILRNMNKKITVDQIEFAITYAKKLKIPIKVQLIFAFPGEDETTVQETIDLFKRVDHPGRRFNVLTPIPGSKIYDDCIKQCLITDEPGYLSDIEKGFGIGKVHVNFTAWPDDEIYPRKRAAEQAMVENYYTNNLFRRTKYFLYRTKQKLL